MDPNENRPAPTTPEASGGAETAGTAGKRGQRGDALVRLGLIVLLVGLICFAVYQCYRHLTTGLNTLRTQEVRDVSYVDLELYLFRDEATVGPTTATEGGRVYLYRVRNGEKVGVGTVLGDIYVTSPDDAAAVQKQLNLYTLRIDRWERNALTLTDSLSVKERVEADYRGVLAAAAGGNLLDMAGYADGMLASLDRYGMLIGSGNGGKDGLNALKADRDRLLTRMAGAGSFSTDMSGWFYYDVDGYEPVFAYESVLTMTPAEFRAMTTTEARPVPTGTAGKLVYNAMWYAVAVTSLADASCFEVGRTYDMLCSGGYTLPMTCVRVEADGEGAMLVFRSLSMPEGFSFERRITAETAYGAVSGYRVPLSSVVREKSPTTGEEVTGVYVLEGNRVVFRRVWVKESREGYLIAYTEAAAQAMLETMDETTQENIKKDGWAFLTLNDNIITQGSGLHDGKVIG